MPPPPSSLASALTMSVVGLWCKGFMGLTTRQFRVDGKEHLYNALKLGQDRTSKEGPAEKGKRRGVLTICNHNSVVDDPMTWAVLPASVYAPFARPAYTCHNNRWTLGASDIMFTSAPMGRFFSLGQVIETVRGGGIYQAAVDTALDRLKHGGWVNIYPEGRVNQEKNNPAGGMRRFKWGVGRIVMDAEEMPEIIPIWISGFDQIMNEHRGFPRFIPRPGANVSITIGQSISPLISPLVDSYRQTRSELDQQAPLHTAPKELPGPTSMRNTAQDGKDYGDWPYAGREDEATRDARIAITARLQEELTRLGERVESEEGRFERGEWAQSRADPMKVMENSVEVPKTR